MKPLLQMLLMLAATLVPTYAMAAPNCNQTAYGICTRCAGWANMSSWSQIACSFTAYPNGQRFPCSPNKCKAFGVVTPLHIIPHLLNIPNGSQGSGGLPK